MPLIVEDGSGVINADSWILLADADAWFSDRNVTQWAAASVAEREAALRTATDYLLFAYRWPGQPTNPLQRLPWPRTGVRSGRGYYPASHIPSQVIDAQMLLALEALNRPITRRVETTPQVIEESKGVKGMNKTIKYATAPVDSVSGLQRYPTVDQILKGIALGALGGDMAVVPLVKR